MSCRNGSDFTPCNQNWNRKHKIWPCHLLTAVDYQKKKKNHVAEISCVCVSNVLACWHIVLACGPFVHDCK